MIQERINELIHQTFTAKHAACLPQRFVVGSSDTERTRSGRSSTVGTSMSTTVNGEDQFAGVPCEFVHTRQVINFGFDGFNRGTSVKLADQTTRRLLGYIVEKPWSAVWNDKVDKVTDLFFEDKKENVAAMTEKVQFHPYMNEMTISVVREIPARANHGVERIEVEDKSGRKAIVPRAWLKVTPKEEFTYGLLYAGTGQVYVQPSEQYARDLLVKHGNVGKYALVRKPKGAENYAYRVIT